MTTSKQRVDLVVHIGDASADATLVEWWKPLDSDIESQGLRFDDPGGGPWLDKEELPPALVAAGGLIVDVVDTVGPTGLASPAMRAGYRVLIEPHPGRPGDPQALAVWSDDRVHVGYLPREMAATIVSESQRRRSTYGAIVLRDYRNADTHERTAIKILVGPGDVWATQPD